MTQIKGTQIQQKTVNFDVFAVDANGNIQLPANVQFNGKNIATEDIFNQLSINRVVEKVTADSNGNYVISNVPAGDVQVIINGLVQVPGDDYTMDGQTIKFTTSPNSDDKVVASYIVFTL
jgi:hypothetical protein